ncbi:hypothetical protein [Lyngbya confervoides]|uniref:Uncharacterized protein n=1 Tax=Lyngbya confervoides BDU141951 TaxID=1574623 RepID=A0ABD4T933_9CYAN|nr:hypothetical protein [Lyngbya confervoides]MCM1984953.1 hypothetical protein [Lyngbya confervoides BDU141951]
MLVYRPPSVWITQFLLMVSLIGLVISLIITLVLCFSANPPFGCPLSFLIGILMSRLLAIALNFLAFWGLQRRKRYGKWLAVSLLVAGMVVVIVESPYFNLLFHSITHWQPLPVPPYECWENSVGYSNERYFCGYENYQQLALRSISEAFPALILGFLAVRLLYGEPARRFFLQ